MIGVKVNFARHVATPHCKEEKRVKLDTHIHTYVYIYIYTTTTKMTMTTINSLVNARDDGLHSNPLCVCARHHQTDEKESVRLIRHSNNSATSRLTPDKQEKKRKRVKKGSRQDGYCSCN
jgi:hypothetical protein